MHNMATLICLIEVEMGLNGYIFWLVHFSYDMKYAISMRRLGEIKVKTVATFITLLSRHVMASFKGKRLKLNGKTMIIYSTPFECSP